MRPDKGLVVAVLLGVSVFWPGSAWGTTSIDVSLVNPGSSTVPSGTPVELQIVGTFNAPLTATAFTISVSQDSNDAGAHLNARSADPNEDNGLAYISRTKQSPFENGLAHNFAAGDAPEVLMDMEFAGEPGGPYDGVDPNVDVIVERIWITPTGTGSITVTLSEFSAVTMPTQGDPNGAFFDTMTITSDEVSLTVQGPTYRWLTARRNKPKAGNVLMDPEPNDPNVPVFPVDTWVTVEAVAAEGKKFDHWVIFDPNYPGDNNHICLDAANNPILVQMDADREVAAHFKCSGGGMAPVFPLLTFGILGAVRLVRRVRLRS